MIINNLYVRWPKRFFGPLEADTPLIVDPYAVLALAFSLQEFEAVARQCGQILQRSSSFKAIEFQPRGSFDPKERLDSLASREVSGSLVSIRDDHQSHYN